MTMATSQCGFVDEHLFRIKDVEAILRVSTRSLYPKFDLFVYNVSLQTGEQFVPTSDQGTWTMVLGMVALIGIGILLGLFVLLLVVPLIGYYCFTFNSEKYRVTTYDRLPEAVNSAAIAYYARRNEFEEQTKSFFADNNSTFQPQQQSNETTRLLS